jgi:transcriptional regulator with XRE-family HTH domain
MTPTELKAARAQLGLSQARLSAALGLAKNGLRTIRRYELGERQIPGPVALAIKYLLLKQTHEHLFGEEMG